METCVRGFSFMPETKVEVVELKYVESEELERTWKTTRRERLKQQEMKIWEEFVKEEDVVRNISQDDPYQFIDQLPDACIKELLDVELQKMKQEIEEVEVDVELEDPEPKEVNNQHVVTFTDYAEKECEMLNIFDDDKDDDVSGPEEEVLNDSIGSPCTVRERQVEDDIQLPVSKHHSSDKISCKSSEENVSNMIESNIYRAKIKELMIKINEELVNILEFLENEDFRSIDPVDVPKIMKRSVEFCSRFSRVHVYPLQRQLSELERRARAGAAARHTRARALHGLHAALQDVQAACDKLDESLENYTRRMTEYFNSIESATASSSRKASKVKGKKKSIGIWSKTGSESYAKESRLSMYSVDPRPALVPKSSNSKESTSIRRLTPVVDTNIRTLVESQPCTSHHMSPDGSPLSSPKSPKTFGLRNRLDTSPKKTTQNTKKQLNVSPRNVTYTKIMNNPKSKKENTLKEAEDSIEHSRNNNGSTKANNKTETRDINMNEKERACSFNVNANSEDDVTRGERTNVEQKKCERDRNKVPESGPASVEVTKLLRQLCGGDAAGY
ncbi:uncharacterized protein LOC126773783 isoform X2 [Nymphalis io]|uniref:uncharacterized protein LOC126773783 isoform X2 n=1 Tax=Inachis io TaxID=171585 RepID=UPI002169B367|nr:uncharacterized protein LOC126773783 isoform X2 [Nymphalis io]